MWAYFGFSICYIDLCDLYVYPYANITFSWFMCLDSSCKIGKFSILVLNFQSCFCYSRTFVFPYAFINQIDFYKKKACSFWLGLHWIYRSIWKNWHLNNIKSFSTWTWHIYLMRFLSNVKFIPKYLIFDAIANFFSSHHPHLFSTR